MIDTEARQDLRFLTGRYGDRPGPRVLIHVDTVMQTSNCPEADLSDRRRLY